VLLKLLWLFLPAAIANITAWFLRSVNFVNYPLDCGYKFRGKALLGNNKTFRGFLFGILAAIITAIVQRLFYQQLNSFSIIDYTKTNPILLGFLLGFGALFGDSLKSFFKRQADIKPGHPWIPFDQLDWIIGASLFLSFYRPISWLDSLIAILFLGLLHPLLNLLGYILGLKENKL